MPGWRSVPRSGSMRRDGERVFHLAMGGLDLHKGNPFELDDIVRKEEEHSQERSSQYSKDPNNC